MKTLRRKSVLFFFMITSCVVSHAQDIAGTWKGTLHVLASDFPLIFHISNDGAGKWTASFDSPSQNGFGLPVSEVITKADSLILVMAVINGKYAGVISQDRKVIDGTWFQANAGFPLSMTKASDTVTAKKILRR